MTTPQEPLKKRRPTRKWILIGCGAPLAALLLLVAVLAAWDAWDAATARSDGFSDEAEKERVWDAYQCNNALEVDPGYYAIQINIDFLASGIPPEDRVIARRYAEALSDASSVDAVMKREPKTRMCTGWLWDYISSQEGYMRDYDTFTLDDAREAGVINE